MRFDNCSFLDQTIFLDGNQYHGCTFSNCRLVFSGEQPLGLVKCTMTEAKWTFAGPAAKTLSFLSAIYNMGDDGKRSIEKTFDDIRLGLFDQDRLSES